MNKLSETSEAIKWLKQFKANDQKYAVRLLDEIILVSRDEFAERLRDLIISKTKSIEGTVGLFVEREIKKWNGAPNRLFKEPRSKVKRATGNGPNVVDPLHKNNQKVGSEGLISQLASELSKEFPKQYIVNPGPTQIRKRRIRAFIVLTDFIGSGQRVEEYLSAAWRVRSVRSWNSFGWLPIHIIAYSGTSVGIRRIKKHKSKPSVYEVLSCPTVDSAFDGSEKSDIYRICNEYAVHKKGETEALGFSGSGALIAFAHVAPNNLPAILYKKERNWEPLFKGRSTADSRGIFGDHRDIGTISSRLKRLREAGITKSGWLEKRSTDSQLLILFLTALKQAPRYDDILSRKTGLTLPEVQAFSILATEWGWIDQGRRLTDEGLNQLRHARKKKKNYSPVPKIVNSPYYPKMLRMPL